jgi:NADH dehydrogenase/NADH:ubiquinone oxidoreductase subunit G
MTTATTPPGIIDITIDGKSIRVPANTTVFDAARMNGIHIPTLCHLQNQTPVGVCRLCVVDTGARVLAASCVRPVEPGIKVVTNSEKVLNARKTLLELLLSDHPSPCARQKKSGDCELETLARTAGITQSRFAKRTVARGSDDSSLAIAVDYDACILCDRCIRGCDEVKSNFVLGRMGKAIRRASRSISTPRWAILHVSPAANAWSLAPPARSPTKASSAPPSQPVPMCKDLKPRSC